MNTPTLARALPLLLALLCAAPAARAGSAEDDLKRRVMVVLRAHEYRPAGKLWRRWGPVKVTEILTEIALDAKAPPQVRGRAALALGELPSDRSQETLTVLIGNPKVPMGVRRQALMAYARGFPKKAAAEVRSRLLKGPALLREAAALATVTLKDPQIETMLRQSRDADPDIRVRAAIERALKERKALARAREKKLPGAPVAPVRPDQRDHL